MKILTEAGRNKHGQKLVRAECACGNTFIAREDNVKAGRTRHCENCRKKPIKKTIPEVIPEVASQHERGSVAFLADEIARKEAALITCENHIRFLEREYEQQTATDLDTIKRRKAEATLANDLRQEIARLRNEKDNKETAVPKTQKTAAELTRERIAAIKGSAQ
jgi:hypothetical protein